MRRIICAIAAAALVALAGAVPEQSATTIEGKNITVRYTPGDPGSRPVSIRRPTSYSRARAFPRATTRCTS